MAVSQCVAKSDVERELVTDLPDQTNQPGNRLLETEFLLVKDFRDRPYHPFRWPFDDAADKNIGMMISRERGLRIEVNRSPIPPLRDNTGPAYVNAAIPRAVRQQHTEFGLDARTAFV